MVIKSVELETVCGITSTIPQNRFPEIAFAGKSNVGKSSLINALMNRKSYARVSEKPGKTQTINFYLINKTYILLICPATAMQAFLWRQGENGERWWRIICIVRSS